MARGTPMKKETEQYGYESIPISTIYRGMNIHKFQLFWCEQKDYRVLTHIRMDITNPRKRESNTFLPKVVRQLDGYVFFLGFMTCYKKKLWYVISHMTNLVMLWYIYIYIMYKCTYVYIYIYIIISSYIMMHYNEMMYTCIHLLSQIPYWFFENEKHLYISTILSKNCLA